MAKSSRRRMVERELDLLGVEPSAPGLAIANPLRGQRLATPGKVVLGDTPDGDSAILWELPPALDRYGAVPNWGQGGRAEQAFWQFLSLGEQDDPLAFVCFVERFGPLGLWPYMTPDGHKVFGLDHWVPSIPDGIQTPHRFVSFETEKEWERAHEAGIENMMFEPISEWRRWSRWFATVVEIGLALRQGVLCNREQWSRINLSIMFETELWAAAAPNFAGDIGLQKRELAMFVQRQFLKWSGLVPILRWEDQAPSLHLALGGDEAVTMRRYSSQTDWPENILFSALVAQLIAVLTSGAPTATCSRCGRIHSRGRKARVDQPVYCGEACRAAARRASKRDYAARQRAVGIRA